MGRWSSGYDAALTWRKSQVQFLLDPWMLRSSRWFNQDNPVKDSGLSSRRHGFKSRTEH